MQEGLWPDGARPVAFESCGVELSGVFCPAAGEEAGPVVVMAHGWSGVKNMLIDYAAYFVERGLSVLAYDHFAFGESGGLPRQEIDPVAQTRGLRDAITFAESLDEVDPEAIGIWGTSYAGGHVLAVAAVDRRVRCVVSQCPTISGWANTKTRFTPAQWEGMVRAFNRDRARRFRGEPAAMVQVIANADTIRRDPSRTHFGNNGGAWYINLDPSRCVGWRDEITLRSLELYAEYEPGQAIERISPTPLMMILAENDKVTPYASGVEAMARVPGPKELVSLPGGHYDLYEEQREAASAAAARWFAAHLTLSR